MRKSDLEEAAVIIPRINPLLESRGESSIKVPEPHFTVEKAENVVVINERRDGVDGGPGDVFEHTFA